MERALLQPSAQSPSPSVTRPPFWRRHRWLLWLLASAAVCLAALSVVLAIAARRVEPFLRAQIIAGLQNRFHTRVELDSFHVQLREGQEASFGIWATGRGLRIWPPHRTGGDHPLEISVQSLPLIELREFSFHVPLRRYDKGAPVHIPEVRLKDLRVDVPPRSERDKSTGLQSAVDIQEHADAQQKASAGNGMFSNIVVQRVQCDHAEVILETSKPDKLPLSFDISMLKLSHIIVGEPMQFEAELTNPRPRGQIDTSGKFGPWNVDDPGMTPLSGNYQFQHANLAEFKGIAGILSSEGVYKGTLRVIVVDGEAMVPDFRLSQFGGKLPLHTRFHARVDGTDGDTYLDRVDAVLGRSQFTTAGKVVRVKPPQPSAPVRTASAAKPAAGRQTQQQTALPAPQQAQLVAPDAETPGHLIDLKVYIPHGQIDDFLRLVSKSDTPFMTGAVETSATLHIPPGEEPVQQKMRLDGYFKVEDARFTNGKTQERIEDLSLRGQGHPDQIKHLDPNSIHWQMQGTFHMAQATITLPDLQYSVPGALIQLHGTYALAGDIHFDGAAHMDATVSQMVGGWKGFLLKPVDRFFKKGGSGALVPIKVRGTREQPDFGLDLSQLNATHPEKPGQK